MHKISPYVCNLVYIGETSNELHLRIDQNRPDSCKFSPSVNYIKSTVELQYFNLHDFKNSKIKTVNIQRKSK